MAIERERVARERRLQECRSSMEYEELKGCTFQPKTNKQPRAKAGRAGREAGGGGGGGGGPVVVRGLGRHLELKELAKRQKEEAATRETKAFHVDKRALAQREGLYTVPVPFNLSVDKRNASHEASHGASGKAKGAQNDRHRRPHLQVGRGGGGAEGARQSRAKGARQSRRREFAPLTNAGRDASLFDAVMQDESTFADASLAGADYEWQDIQPP